MKYKIFRRRDLESCVPSTDYYSRKGDWETHYGSELDPYGDVYDTVEEAVEWLKEQNYTGEFLFIPTIII